MPFDASGKGGGAVPFSSNEIRLSAGECLVTLGVIILLFTSIPGLWQYVEPFEPGEDYRIPYVLSDDYWLYNQYCRLSAKESDVMVIGDSVVWGHYVGPGGSLSHYLNEMADTETFANMGIDGIHPAAMAGLIEYYGMAITGKRVVLSFNPLWMTSQKHDLQTEKEFRFNHPRLVPQFVPRIACYTESLSNRIGIVMERNVRFFSWASHIRTTYYNKMDMANWAVEHPYKCPFRAVSFELPRPEETVEENEAWNERGMGKDDFPWVGLDTSVQWKFFKRTIDVLRERGNTVFVLIGPFNEHMMKDESLSRYRSIKAGVEKWLRENDVPYYMPAPLPSELYADASHPLRAGYQLLARQLLDDESFRSNILRQDSQAKQ